MKKRFVLKCEEKLTKKRRPHVKKHIFFLLQVRDAGNLLTRAGFTLPGVDVDEYTIRYNSGKSYASCFGFQPRIRADSGRNLLYLAWIHIWILRFQQQCSCYSALLSTFFLYSFLAFCDVFFYHIYELSSKSIRSPTSFKKFPCQFFLVFLMELLLFSKHLDEFLSFPSIHLVQTEMNFPSLSLFIACINSLPVVQKFQCGSRDEPSNRNYRR